MKRITLSACLVLFLGVIGLAQDWAVINSGIPANINGVTYMDSLHLFCVGSNGSVYGSSDGGLTWSSAYTGTTPLNSITAINENTAIAVGWNGVILRYNGTSWSTINSGTNNALFGVSFGTEQVGYACGEDGIILKSTNAGLTWTTIRMQRGEWLSGLHALDDVHVAAVSEFGTLFQTADGGLIWTTMLIPGAPWMGDVMLTGPGTGWCCGTAGTLYYFTGTSLIPFDLGTSDGMLAMAFLSLQYDLWLAFMVGDNGSIFEFMFGDWTAVISPTTQNLFAAAALLYYLGYDQSQVSDSAMALYCAGGEDGTIVLNSQVVIGYRDPEPGQNSSFLYPVPSRIGVCFIRGEIPVDGIDVTVHDLTGKQVHAQTIRYVLTPIDLRDLPDGLYLARISKGNRIFTEKILIQRE